MPGGLLQISGLSAESLFLNGAPEITFFKTVYRRHTNFAIESLVVNFEDPVEFNSINTVKISQTGDLMHKVYLQVTLPEINLFRTTMPDPTEYQILYNTTKNNYDIVLQFMDINRVAYVDAYNIFIAENNIQNATRDMINAINNAFNNHTIIIDQMQALLLSDPNVPFTYDEISMQSIANKFDAISNKDELFRALTIGIDKSVKTQKYFYYQMYDASVILDDVLNPHIKFAWIKRIGHFVAEYIEVKIGGHAIDKQYGVWMNIWYELTANRSIEPTYFKLIGNVSELTEFNRQPKPKYILNIPLQFWFCRFSGSAIPLVALEYHDVSFQVKFRSIQELSYIEAGTTIKYSLSEDGITLDELPDIIPNININANLLVDFYYLDSHERRRFAQSSHEYIIDQVQLITQTVTQPTIQLLLNSFVHPTKDIFWIAQKQSNTENISGYNQCKWDDYSISDGQGNPIAYSTLLLNSYTRINRTEGNYFNYLVPYQNYYTTPSDGVNVYSFAIYPTQFQPSCTCNFSMISRIVLQLELSNLLFNTNGTIIEPLDITVYSRNVNILKFSGGFGGLVYVYLQ